jgi:hypothetical protein
MPNLISEKLIRWVINLDVGEYLTFAIRLYVQIPWTRYDLPKVAEDLNGDLSQQDWKEN